MNVGKAILMELQQQGRTAKWLATQIPCERTNVYKIVKKYWKEFDSNVNVGGLSKEVKWGE